jgi:hypothetical protein
MTGSTALGPLTPNACADAAHEVARVLRAARSEWQPAGRVENLGSSAALIVQRGARREPGDPPSTVDTLERVRLNFGREQR